MPTSSSDLQFYRSMIHRGWYHVWYRERWWQRQSGCVWHLSSVREHSGLSVLIEGFKPQKDLALDFDSLYQYWEMEPANNLTILIQTGEEGVLVKTKELDSNEL